MINAINLFRRTKGCFNSYFCSTKRYSNVFILHFIDFYSQQSFSNTKIPIIDLREIKDNIVYITNQSRNYFIYKMEKGLYSGNSLTKTHKLYKKNRGSLSSLDESALKHYEKFPSSSLTNFRKYLQNPSMRNTFADFKSPLKTQ